MALGLTAGDGSGGRLVAFGQLGREAEAAGNAGLRQLVRGEQLIQLSAVKMPRSMTSRGSSASRTACLEMSRRGVAEVRASGVESATSAPSARGMLAVGLDAGHA